MLSLWNRDLTFHSFLLFSVFIGPSLFSWFWSKHIILPDLLVLPLVDEYVLLEVSVTESFYGVGWLSLHSTSVLWRKVGLLSWFSFFRWPHVPMLTIFSYPGLESVFLLLEIFMAPQHNQSSLQSLLKGRLRVGVAIALIIQFCAMIIITLGFVSILPHITIGTLIFVGWRYD